MNTFTDVLKDGVFLGDCWVDDAEELFLTFPFATLWVPSCEVTDFIGDLRQLLVGLESLYPEA